MKEWIRIPVVLVVLLGVAACGGNAADATSLPLSTPQSTITPPPTSTVPASTCPPADAGGTVPPAIAICSTTFVVNGLEQVVRAGDELQASRGDQVRVKEVAVCVGPFSGNGGEACVDFVPLDRNGQEIASERHGTHMMKVSSGCKSVPGPDGLWTVGEGWQSISVVLNHWPLDSTADTLCAGGKCERDDRVIVGLR